MTMVHHLIRIYEYYDVIKTTIDPDKKGYGDSDIAKRLLAECEKTFKTVSTEMATIKETVADGISSVNIIATVKEAVNASDTYGDDEGKNITAAIFATASENGSDIKLTADNITIDAGHKLNLSTGTFTVTGSNFSVDASGSVSMAGTITATSGAIGGITISSNSIHSENNHFSVDSSGYLTATNANISGNITATSLTIAKPGYEGGQLISDYVESKVSVALNDILGGSDGNYNWFNGAMHTTSVSGGLVLTGNLLVGASDNNITAGVLGGSTGISSNDLRFFAGPDMSTAPFKVYADGHLEATDATIAGNVTARMFAAETSQSIDYSNVSYNVTKSTTITGDTFEIGLSNVPSGLENFGENKIYIKLVNELEDGDHTISTDGKLYCVPVLCMKYCGREYMLSPASWISSSLPAEMWWYKMWDAKKYTYINPSLTGIYYVSTTSGNCYMYYDNASIVITSTDDGIYQLNYNVSDEAYRSEVELKLLSTTPPLIDNSKNGKYELGYRDDTHAVVSDSNCTRFANYLSGTYDYGISSDIQTKSNSNTTDLTKYGLQKAIDFIKEILGNTGNPLSSNYGSVYGWYNGPTAAGTSTGSVTFGENDVYRLIPFLTATEKTNYNGLETGDSEIKVDIQYTPIKKLGNGDLLKQVSYIDFTIKYTINCTYTSTGTSNQITINGTSYNVSSGEFILECNCLLAMYNPYTDNNNGKPTALDSDDAWEIYLPKCFNNIDFNAIPIQTQKDNGVFKFTGDVRTTAGSNSYIHIEKKP